jgi:hypothetical protein
MERLAGSEDDYEAYLDALHVVRSLEEEPAGETAPGGEGGSGVEGERPVGERAVPRRASPRKRWTRFPPSALLAAAAVLAALLLGPWLLSRAGSPAGYAPAALVASLDTDARAGAYGQAMPWRVLRSADALLAPAERAFRLGVRHVQLEAAAAAGDDPAARDLALDMATLADGLPAGAPFGALYRELATLPAADPAAAELRRQAWDALLDAAPAPEARLGAWAAAARHAVAAGDPAWTRGAAAARERAAVDADALEPATRAAWEDVLAIMDHPAAMDAGRLAGALDALLRAGAG